jgi:sucrose phosphorylase
MIIENKIYQHLKFIYGEEFASPLTDRLIHVLRPYQQLPPVPDAKSAVERVNETDVILITYADMVQEEDIPSLESLTGFLKDYTAEIVSTVHILPFFPYSSDDGFSVIDYKAIKPEYGDWENIAELGQTFRLMFDAVINHISSKSNWFQGYLGGDSRYRYYFTEVEPGIDLSSVFRPRALPLLTEFNTSHGKKYLWTTFSKDQIDLNYQNPDVLMDIVDVLLTYVSQGAEFIRLDAVGFIWKEIGTSCIHLPEAHRIVQLIRTILDYVSPKVSIITETNVPHQENVSYFGDGTNEAQMVYNFSLPPLTLNALHTGSANAISKWADSLDLPSDQVTFFNFLASHDGIGLMPVRDILSEAAINKMVERVEAGGGFVSYKTNLDGTESAYEMNVNYLDALKDPSGAIENTQTLVRKFLCSQAIMLAFQGVPGIYFHSLFGSRNWMEGVEQTGRYRTINREKLNRQQLETEIKDPQSLRFQIYNGYHQMLSIRRKHAVFHPSGRQDVLFLGENLFTLRRTSPDGDSQVICLFNVSDHNVDLSINLSDQFQGSPTAVVDLINQEFHNCPESVYKAVLGPYQVSWLKPDEP